MYPKPTNINFKIFYLVRKYSIHVKKAKAIKLKNVIQMSVHVTSLCQKQIAPMFLLSRLHNSEIVVLKCQPIGLYNIAEFDNCAVNLTNSSHINSSPNCANTFRVVIVYFKYRILSLFHPLNSYNVYGSELYE